MTRAREILVGVDGSAGSEVALRWAVREAELRPGPVTALLGWTADGLPRGVFQEAAYADHDGLAEAATRILDQAVTHAVDPHTKQQIKQVVVDADPVEAMVKRAGTTDMIVVGARGHGPVHRMLAGSVSQGIVHHSPVPVIVVRGPVAASDAEDTRPVVVGVDGSPSSLAALRWAGVEAHARGVQLRVVHAWGGADPLYPELMAAGHQALVAQAQRSLDETVATGAGDAANVDAVLAGDWPVRALLRESTDAQLVVVGNRGRGGFAELVLGSVSHQCVLYAACPVAVVRNGQ